MVLCLCILMMPFSAFASTTADAGEPIDTSRQCSLTLNYVHSRMPFEDLPAQVYFIAAISQDYQFTPTEAFASANLTLNGVTSNAEWDVIRTTLESYILANDLEPDYDFMTESDGSVVITGLVPGLYLVMPIYFETEEAYCRFDSSLVTVPALSDEGTWDYNVRAIPKPYIEVNSKEKIDFSVVKLWKDDSNTKKRPVSIEVEILKNGETYETVTLSEENNWHYSWTVYDNGDKWQVVERNVPEGYVMTVEENKTTFTIVNTLPEPPESPDTGDSADVFLYAFFMCLSGFMLIALSIISKRSAE